MLLVQEDTTNLHRSANPFLAAKDAQDRAELAKKLHKDFFESEEHIDRLDAVSDIIFNFFGQRPTYFTPRGIGRQPPFENVKIEHVGRLLSRTKIEAKNQNLYEPLLALNDVEVISKNGHLSVRVYQTAA